MDATIRTVITPMTVAIAEFAAYEPMLNEDHAVDEIIADRSSHETQPVGNESP